MRIHGRAIDAYSAKLTNTILIMNDRVMTKKPKSKATR